jgi:hypothetical protein
MAYHPNMHGRTGGPGPLHPIFNDHFTQHRQQMDEMQRSNMSLAKGFIAAWAVWALLSLAASVAIVCVIVHFVSKFW